MKNDAPEHKKIGKIQPELIKTLGIKSKILDEQNFEKNCDWAITHLKKDNIVALVIRREFLD